MFACCDCVSMLLCLGWFGVLFIVCFGLSDYCFVVWLLFITCLVVTCCFFAWLFAFDFLVMMLLIVL